MSLLDRLERRCRRYAIPNVTLILIGGHFVLFVMGWTDEKLLPSLVMSVPAVLGGEVWRLATFVFVPPTLNPLWLFFALYLFFLMGTALEAQWGAFRYNVYLLIAYLATLAVAFATMSQGATAAFIEGSVFLAFAHLFPDFELYIFFLLPIKVKCLALLAWIGFGWAFISGDWATRLLVAAPVANFLLFFGRDIVRRVRYARGRMTAQVRAYRDRDKPFHRCAACGATERSHPDMDFRVCPDCDGAPDYCVDHIRDHEHIGKKRDA